jgi:hypothetical protein
MVPDKTASAGSNGRLLEAELDELLAGVPENGEFYSSQAFTLADALQPREALPSVVKGILRPGGLYLPFSSPGMFKTLLFMDLCQCVSMGQPWLAGVGNDKAPGIAVTQCPTLWIDQDNGGDIMRERMAALGRGYQGTDTPFYCLSFPTPGIAASRSLSALEKTAQHFGAGLVVFDNLLRIAGVRDENAAEVDLAMGNLRTFAEVTGAAVLVFHHRRKDASGREGDSIRGHSSIEAALDGAYLVTREDNSDVVTVKNTKWRRRQVATFAALWTYEHEADGETLHSARFYHAQPPDHLHDTDEAIREGILAALQGGPMVSKDLKAAVVGRGANIISMLATMQLERAIICKAGQRGAKIFSLPA